MNVLIVDDNEAAADLLQELLSLQDHQAHCSYTAQQAIDASTTQRFDAALVDLTLPDFPGTEVARRLRSAAGDQPLLLVAISGFSVQDAPGAEARELFDHYLQKPIDFDALDRILAAPGAHAPA
ncbi:MAG: response regulator [Variovorax sp.]